MLTIDEIKNKVGKIAKRYGVKSAYLFGSYARGEATKHSDIDILIDQDSIKTYKKFFNFCEDLEGSLGEKVDVMTDGGLRPRLLNSINRDRVLLYEA